MFMTPGIYTRRQILQVGGKLASGGFLTLLDPRSGVSSVQASTNQAGQQAAPPSDRVAEMRAQASKTPLKTQPLGDNILMLYGPGGNMVALSGPDGKVLVDSSYSPVVPEILQAIKQMGNPPLKLLINTHWHIDHTDGNAGLHEAGATILSHENTLKRLSTPRICDFSDCTLILPLWTRCRN